MIGIINRGPGTGDKLQFAAIPEIFYRNTGEKVVDIQNCFVYDYNPYVQRGAFVCNQTLDLWNMSSSYAHANYLSTSERFFKNTGFKHFKVELRHPRLYRFEELPTIPNRLVIHTTGKSEGGKINENVIEHIKTRYNNYDIIQIGGKYDVPVNCIDKRGLNFWDTAEIIAQAAIFIGVDSGSGIGVANCYPRISRKVILNRQDLDTIFPLNKNTGWLDFNVQYFNQTENDIGSNYSFLKI